MRIAILILLVLLAILNHRLWLSDDGGLQKVWLLQDAIKAQDSENQSLKERNATLEAEVKDLKEGFAAIEERARIELGMIRQGETFFHILEGLPPAAPAPAGQKPPIQQQVVQKQGRQRVGQKPAERQPAVRKRSANRLHGSPPCRNSHKNQPGHDRWRNRWLDNNRCRNQPCKSHPRRNRRRQSSRCGAQRCRDPA